MRRPRALVLLCALALVTACGEDEPPDWLVDRALPTTTTAAPTTTTTPPTTEPTVGREEAAIDLVPGSCLREAGAFVGEVTNEVTMVAVVPCRVPHQVEVFARADVGGPDAAYPGPRVLRRQAQERCQDAFRPYVRKPWTASALEIAALWPSPQTWRAGDRTVVCALFRANGRALTGTARNSQI